MGHAATADGSDARPALDLQDAVQIAETMGVLSTPSRVRLLAHLRRRSSPVTELAHATDMTPSAASQQLRVLRQLGLVTTRRRGKQIIYTLHDSHVVALLDEAIGHNEHRKLAQPSRVRD
jgi:ArsR family transcriptional regulator, nickel/cobalt-responsive transcriptional repressor